MVGGMQTITPPLDTDHLSWDLHETGPADANRRVVLIAGALCSAGFYDELMAQPLLTGAGIRLVAATLPGFAGTPGPRDPTMATYARLTAAMAAEQGADVVVGHSMGANVALEMAGSGLFSGPLVLLAPTFSREDEFKELGTLNRIGRVPGVGLLAWMAALNASVNAFKGTFPAARRDALVAAMQRNDPRFCRRALRRYFEYLDGHGSLAPRLCESGVAAWVVRGGRDEIGLKDDERRILEACATTTMVDVGDAGHFTMLEQPGTVAELILAATAAASAAAGGPQRPIVAR
jgi:pimeloyl-ACP methyl ester carboxylesterase